MLQSLENLRRYSIRTIADDDRTGSVVDTLFEDRDFIVRYLVIDTGDWLPGRRVLVSPESVPAADHAARVLYTSLTAQQIEDSPPLSADAPISQEYRRALALHYGWSAFSAYHPIMGGVYGPFMTQDSRDVVEHEGGGRPSAAAVAARESSSTSSLRSIKEVIGYDIHGTDEGVGHLEDMIVDTATWAIRYFVVDTVNWLPFSKKVLIPTTLLRDISFMDQHVSVALTKEQIKSSPSYDPGRTIDTAHELEVFDCYIVRDID
jgi:sporulation protein YlmC with PRC-barrel domain